MAVLALDASGNACSVALWAAGAIRAERFEARTRGQAERLVPLLQEVVTESGVGFAGVERVAVVCGPGSFTGVRVALATARALGMVLRCPVEGYDAFRVAVAALPGAADRSGRLLVAVDSRRREPFVQLFEGGLAAGAARAASPEDITAAFEGQTLVLAGNAAESLAALLRPRVDARVAPGEREIRAATLAEAAGVRRIAPVAPEPLYLRPPDVTGPANKLPAPEPSADDQLRLLGPEDAAALADLHARCFPTEPWNAAAWHSLGAIDGTLFLGVATPSGELVAFCALRRQFDEAEVLSVGVDPACRRLGHGRRLLSAGLSLLAAAGTRRVVLEVAEDNAEALSLYRSLGFSRAGRRPGYYRRVDGGRCDAALLERPLQ